MADKDTLLFFGDEEMSNKTPNEDFLKSGNPYEEDDNPLMFGDTKFDQKYYDNIRKEVADQIGRTQPNQSEAYFEKTRKDFINQINQLPIKENLDLREKSAKKDAEIVRLKEQLNSARDVAQKYRKIANNKRVKIAIGATIIFVTGVFTGIKGYQNKDRIEDFFTPNTTSEENGLPSVSFLKAYANEYSEYQYKGLWYDLGYLIECVEEGREPDPNESLNRKAEGISDEYAEAYKEENGYYPSDYVK